MVLLTITLDHILNKQDIWQRTISNVFEVDDEDCAMNISVGYPGSITNYK
jgi:hypothetical protein